MSTPMNHMKISSHMGHPSYSSADAVHRHNYGVQKNRKAASTGGGRAWSEDEEVYLLQTRLQKMPYKHIAAHLKKTELACRLHYHQLSHGANRRKRTNSMSSGDTSAVNSPIIQHALPSPIHEQSATRPTSPQYKYSPQAARHFQLPSPSTLLPRSGSSSPLRNTNHPVAILPKPSVPRRALSDSAATPSLRLDCDVATQSAETISSIDKERLRLIYEAHRSSFWSVIASEYGGSVAPMLLEEAWKKGIATHSPPTPCISPDSQANNGYQSCHARHFQQLNTPVEQSKLNTTSISALLGIDASPTSPQEREMIKKMEERREFGDFSAM
ncbi:hypothetical protein BJ878DRAFT_503119 [Calycina marina]|uniref:Myb-like domain-containing protein n=1 Tax=Calycina marina TaxID=1763456 RepID=A0A9P7Z4G1_9HELO|nr:hypothetical protein BJ878DRAFT_503119 [Calycina marina]